MQFNFKLFSALAAKAYRQVDNPLYTLGNVLAVFELYFSGYEDAFREIHPPIRTAQIERIINEMPFIDDVQGDRSMVDLEPEDYRAMIERHFQTQYRNCDYNINHFFSGDIRLMRFYEAVY